MFKIPLKKCALAGAIATVTLVGISGCSTTASEAPASSGSEMSRVKSYSSLDALEQDSSLVVVGTVQNQEVKADIDPVTDFTLSEVKVESVVAGDGASVGDNVVVRQMGSTKDSPSGILAKGDTYLLYLTPSGLDGELADQYYVTGANAGIYEADDSAVSSRSKSGAMTFKQFNRDDGDDLPSGVTVDGSSDVRPSE